MTFWTPERVKELHTLSKRGWTTSRIAKKLGCSGNSVIGKLSRERSAQLVWSQAKINELKAHLDAGLKAKECAEAMGMSLSAIRSAMGKYELKSKWAPAPKPEKPKESKRAPQWTEGELDRLRELIDAGKTYAEISADIGRSDYAVRDKVKKLGLRVTTKGTHAKRAEPMPKPILDADHSRRIAAQVEALRGKTECRYPVGNLEDEDFHFCRAEVTDDDTPYCPEHSALCFAKPAPRQRPKERVRVSTLSAAGYF